MHARKTKDGRERERDRYTSNTYLAKYQHIHTPKIRYKKRRIAMEQCVWRRVGREPGGNTLFHTNNNLRRLKETEGSLVRERIQDNARRKSGSVRLSPSVLHGYGVRGVRWVQAPPQTAGNNQTSGDEG
ncbi:hypothetical protein RR46_13646 [Papilio xuthus]|uniref:Uncharacterized protein n=1 Tax=Papilio xuthus TaxID=66420 RepID=A0A194PMS6_PAPXU|nr:hypothetical protein RR46_13646 [Papilio xuthus]